MNSAVLEVAQSIGVRHSLNLREVIARFRRVGLEFRTETNHTFEDNLKLEEQVLLGYSYEGFYHPVTEENLRILEDVVVSSFQASKEAQQAKDLAAREAREVAMVGAVEAVETPA